MLIGESIEQQARSLADYSRKAEPGITKVYWFSADDEIRLVSLYAEMPASDDGELHPFYFGPSPGDGLTAGSAVAMIQPGEFGSLKLPDGWGQWDEAIEI